MAETFLNELLQTANSVPSDDQNRDCVICLQETGTMSRDTGLIELQLRLPCRHIVGSGCITTWLRENNSCPLCRREFFPSQPRSYFEHDELESEDEDDGDQEDENQVDFEIRQVMFEDLCEEFCIQLGLDDITIQTAQNICQNISDRGVLFLIVSGVHDYAIVALAVYIASCVAGHARSPREICRVRDENDDPILESYGISCDNIREAYDTVYDRREELIDYDLKRLFERRGVLVWPSVGHARSDEQIERARDLLAAKTGCSKYCDQLQVAVPVDELSQHIAANLINEGFHALGYPENSRYSYVFPLEIAAVSIYIASHLVGKPIHRRAIQDLVEDEYVTVRFNYRVNDIRSIYRTVSDKRDQLVDEVFRKSLALDLNWQSLEIDVGEEGGDGRYGDR